MFAFRRIQKHIFYKQYKCFQSDIKIRKMIVQRSQSRKRQHSSNTRTKFEVELPKINKTTLLLKDKEKQNNIAVQSYAETVAWVVETVDYTQLNDHQIDQEYNQLRKQLHNINIQVAKAIGKLDLKVIKKHKTTQQDPLRTLEIRDKQVQNNNAVIDRLRKEYMQLQKRASSVSIGTKDEIEQQIEKTKEDLDKMKKKIKDLKLKNKTIGDSIMSSDDLFAEIKKLQNQKQVNERKKMKLQSKTDHVYDQISNSQLKLEQISDDYQVAENYFEEYYNKNQINQQQREIENKYRHAKYCLQIVQKKNQTSNNLKQQKYHIALKNLQNQMGKLNVAAQKTASIQLQIIHCKKLIIQYQEIYRQNQQRTSALINQQPIFFTQFETDTNDKSDKNDKNENKQIKNYHSVKLDPKIERNQSENQQKNKKQNQLHNLDFQKKPLQQPTAEQIKSKERKRIQTSNGLDQEEEQDIIVDLDEKFKYKTKTQMRNSRYNEKQTEIGDDVMEDLVDEDDELIDFKTKIFEQKVKRKSREKFDFLKDLSKVKDQLESIDLASKHKQSGEQQDMQ